MSIEKEYLAVESGLDYDSYISNDCVMTEDDFLKQDSLQFCRDFILSSDSFDFESLFFNCSHLLFLDLKKYVDDEIKRKKQNEKIF